LNFLTRPLLPLALLLVSACATAHAHPADPPQFAQVPPEEISEPPAPDKPAVRQALAARRSMQIKRLQAYRNARLFPRNRVSDKVINVFRDEDGLLCAVANLIFLDGDLKLVAKTAKDDNYVRMGELEDGPVLDWILGSGFTQEEIAAIQLPDSPITNGDYDWFAEENARIIAHLDNVVKALVKNTEASLEIAAERALASNTVTAALIAPTPAPTS
jgi:hypothetical protein